MVNSTEWATPPAIRPIATSDLKSANKGSTPTSATRPNLPLNALTNGASAGRTAGKVQPRIEVENIYLALREGLEDNWATYNDAVRSFFRGLTNRMELDVAISPLLIKPELQRLHNQYFLAAEINAMREIPESDVAPFVTQTGKPNSMPKPVTGDAHERRLKKEVMSLPARDRRRMKEIPEGNEDLNSTLQRHYVSRQVKYTDTGGGPLTSAGLNKNWQTELTAAYSSALASESGEYMDTDSIIQRCTPICYNEGLSGSVSEDAARFVGLATDMFVRDILGTLFSRIRLEPEQRVLKEVNHNSSSALALSEKRGGTVNMEHLKLSVGFSDNLVRQMPLSVYNILGGTSAFDRYEELDEGYWDEDEGERKKRIKLDFAQGFKSKAAKANTGAGGASWDNPASSFLMDCLNNPSGN